MLHIKQKEKLHSEIECLVKSGERKFAICPFGEFGKYVKFILNDKFQIQEERVFDNYKTGEGIYSVESLEAQPLDADTIFLVTVEFPELQKGLRNLLLQYVPPERIVTLLERKVDSGSVEKQLKYKEEGRQIIREIAADPDKLYLFFFGANGDVLAAASLMAHVKKLHGFARAALVCLGKHRDFAEMFEAFDEAIIVPKSTSEKIWSCAKSYEDMYGENYILGNIHLLDKIWALYDNRLDPFKLAILQIPQYCQPARVSPDFITTPVEELKAKWNKCILLAPYANTFGRYPDKFWELLVKELKDKGYQIYCNVFGTENEIKGTIRFEASFREAFAMSMGADGVISNRSGFSDVIALNLDVKHVVINPTESRAKYEDIGIYGSKKIVNLVWTEEFEPLVSEIAAMF